MRNTEILGIVVEFGESYDFEARHARQVAKLALQLFDQLQPLHGMGNTERIWLRAAAMLHDIGKAQDPENHHKLARDIIFAASELPFRREERAIIGLVARYHRGSLPCDDHRHFRDLDADARLYVRELAALLRLADGLDKGHSQYVESVQCSVRRRRVLVRVVSTNTLNADSILGKAGLFEEVFRRRIAVHVSVHRRRLGAALDFSAPFAYVDADRS